MIVNADMIEALKAEGYKWFIESYEKEPEIFSKIADVQPTELGYVKETVATGGGRLQKKPYGGEYKYGSLKEAWTPIIKIDEFGELLGIEGATMEDIQHKAENILRKKMPIYAEQARYTKEYELADIFSYGALTSGHHDTFDQSADDGSWTDPSGDFCYDGKPVFVLSTNARTAKDGSTYYNLTSGKALNHQGISDLCALISDTNAYNESGEKVVIMPDTLIVATYSNLLTARRVLESEKVSGSNYNDKNVIKDMLKPIWNPFLSDDVKNAANAFIVGKAKKGIRFYTRVEPEFDFFEDKKSNIFYIRVRVRFGAGVVNWRYWAANDLPTS